MTETIPVRVRVAGASLLVLAAQFGFGLPAALAQQAPAAPAAEAAPEAPTAMTSPSMTGPLVANPDPFGIETDVIGKVYVTGALTGFGMVQSNPTPVFGDHSGRIDGTNAHLNMQITDGWLQPFATFGAYSFPTVGTPYLTLNRTTGDFFGGVPVAYGKFVVNDSLNFTVGKLPTLIGAEYAFTYQNMNIERGLLWAQEPIVSRGIQGNYTTGPFTFAVSLNDGYYSGRYTWLSGSAAYALNKENTFTVVAGGNTSSSGDATLKTPLFQNNGELFNLIYTYSSAPWTITPYFQYTHVKSQPGLGLTNDASTYGGAILVNYAFNDNVSLSGRAEYIGSSGNSLSPNLLYGPGSNAFSFTLTPTYQIGTFFIRVDASIVHADSTTPGFAFGRSGNSQDQARLVIETGFVF
jgi:hypothetical protein